MSFEIVNETTRQLVENPADKVERVGGVAGLADHTVLLAKDGREIAIDDSVAPILNGAGGQAGTVLVLRELLHAGRLSSTETGSSEKGTGSSPWRKAARTTSVCATWKGTTSIEILPRET